STRASTCSRTRSCPTCRSLRRASSRSRRSAPPRARSESCRERSARRASSSRWRASRGRAGAAPPPPARPTRSPARAAPGPLSGRLRKAALAMALAVLVLGIWIARNHAVSGRTTEYVSQFLAADPEASESGGITATGLLDRIWRGFSAYFETVGDLLFLR